MKLRYLSLILFQVCALPLFAMSPDEKIEFKRQLKAAKTSHEMRKVLNTKLQKGQKIVLKSDNFTSRLRIYFTSETPGEVLYTPLLRSVCSAVDEVFFEEMHPFFFEQEDEKIALTKLEKYTWAEGNIVGIFGSIFKIKKQLDKDGRVFRSDEDKLPKFQFIKNRVAEVSGENRLFGGKNDFSKRLAWSADKTLESILFSSKTTKYTVGGIIAVVVIGGIYYCATKSEKQSEEENEAEQETINNDDAQDASGSTK